MSVTLLEIMAAARVRRASVVAETAGYLVLGVADQIASAPRVLEPGAIALGADGSLAALGGVATSDERAGDGLRALLALLMEVSGSTTPGLFRAAHGMGGGVEAVVRALETALIPVNRAAARRALSRLHRETERALASGIDVAAETAIARSAVTPPPQASPVPRAASPAQPWVASPEPTIIESPAVLAVPELVFASPEPEPVFASPEPEPVFVSPEPEPVFASPEPEPVFAAPEPEPVFASPEPEPVFVSPEPEPVVLEPSPLDVPIVVELEPEPVVVAAAPVEPCVRALEAIAPGFDQLTPAEPSVARANARRLRSVTTVGVPTPPLGTLMSPADAEVGVLELVDADATERMPEVELLPSPLPSPVAPVVVEAWGERRGDGVLAEPAAPGSEPGASDVRLRVEPSGVATTADDDERLFDELCAEADAVAADDDWDAALREDGAGECRSGAEPPDLEPEVPAPFVEPDAGRAAPTTPLAVSTALENVGPGAPRAAAPQAVAPAPPRFAPRRSDVSELLAGFVPADAAGDRDLCRDLKELAGMSATPPPVAVAPVRADSEDGAGPARRAAGGRSR